MTINLKIPDIQELKPRIIVFGVGGAGGNAVNNMITAGLQGVDFVVANTDAQALASSKAQRIVQMGVQVTEGLGAGSQPEVGRAAAEEVMDEIRDHLNGVHMVFVTAGMGGGTGTGAAPVIARVAKEMGILTVGVVTKPFHFEGQRRMRFAEIGISDLHKVVDTLLVIPNQNLFRVANEKTTFADAFAMADQVLYSGVACITDLMVKEGLINLDFADVRAVMREMGKAMMGTGEASGEKRAATAAEAAIANPLIDDSSMKGAKGLLVSITGGKDLTLYEVDEAATRIREEVDQDANIIVGATFDETLEGVIRVSVVATGIDSAQIAAQSRPIETPRVEARPEHNRLAELNAARRVESQRLADRIEQETRSAMLAARNAQPKMEQPVPSVAASDAAHAAVAAALMPAAAVEDVSIRPIPLKPTMFEPAPVEPVAISEEPPPESFIPPQAEQTGLRKPRMPRVDELPLPAQAQIKAARGEAESDQHPARQRMGLMQRLAAVGLGRREEPAIEPPVPVAPRPVTFPPRQARPADPPVSEYARRSTPQGLDPHGRPAPVHNSAEDDQLDIPAFLRRQAN
ncbi:MAG: cell division protein FtsZ [Rhizobiales bacterium]|nr:cell division protein FtsZ [Hyphomicrobiales bacterium]OJY43318.1 MAG: cell division protein FtsZ [Rhizobiales bacterium 64-17]